MRKKVRIPKARLEKINKYLIVEPKNEEECLPEDTAITYTCRFDDEYEVDVKCCGVQFEEGGNNTAWTEAVLFKNGCEVSCSEPSEEFDGEWTLWDGNREFTVLVETE